MTGEKGTDEERKNEKSPYCPPIQTLGNCAQYAIIKERRDPSTNAKVQNARRKEEGRTCRYESSSWLW